MNLTTAAGLTNGSNPQNFEYTRLTVRAGHLNGATSMIIDFKTLLETLDASPLPNQDVRAADALVIKFGDAPSAEEVIYDTASGTAFQVCFDEFRNVVSIEFL